MQTSRIPEFYKKSYDERLQILKEQAGLSDEEIHILKLHAAASFGAVDRMIENVVSVMFLPLGMATNFLINGEEYIIPMAVEESSVVAAACNAAKLARYSGGFTVKSSKPIMIGQIQLLGIVDFEKAKSIIFCYKDRILALANAYDRILIANGGGAIDIEIEMLQTKRGPMLVVYLLVNVCDAMGSNIVNTMVEAIAPFLESLTGGYARLRIVSNYAVRRMVKAVGVWKKDIIGSEVVEGILDADALAFADVHRASTHNKGIMNGIDAVVLATGNDFRAVEAGAHSYALRNGAYQPLSTYYKNENGDLVGELEMPLAVGIVGGITKSHPIAQLCLKILRVQSACQLAQIMGAVGLAQNFAALRVLVREGVQRGHMRLHSKNIAGNVGAVGDEIDIIADRMVNEHCISANRARELFEELRK
ncbi:hydroxymethylglutaryl-CoA reductase, degradative [Candidatus Dependentiae bacterium]|nr:hydroxymethylglutaryl-CoA reductase, degradative [Candidatus Dependentiae bacterium]